MDVRGILERTKEQIRYYGVVFAFYLFRLIPINKKKIVVSSFAGRGDGAEGKGICDALLNKNLDLDIVWLCRGKNALLPREIRLVEYKSVRAIYELATAKVWIDNQRKRSYVRKRRKQFYVQTWHGNVCIKKVEKDAASLSKEYLKAAKNDSQMANVFVSGSKWRDWNYKNAFWFNGEIIRGDLYNTKKLLNESKQIKKAVCDYFKIPIESKIVLYAPTFRQDSRLDCYDIDYNRMLDTVQKKYGNDWCVVVRLHPNIASLNHIIVYSDKILNGSLYPKVNDLLVVCDYLITDYSGVMFDGFQYGKKVILYASDLDRYVKEEREMYFDLKKLPAPIACNNDDLNEQLSVFDVEKYESARKELVEHLGYYATDASEAVSNRIIKEMRK